MAEVLHAHSVERWSAERYGKKMGMPIFLYADELASLETSTVDDRRALIPVETCRSIAKSHGLAYKDTTKRMQVPRG